MSQRMAFTVARLPDRLPRKVVEETLTVRLGTCTLGANFETLVMVLNHSKIELSSARLTLPSCSDLLYRFCFPTFVSLNEFLNYWIMRMSHILPFLTPVSSSFYFKQHFKIYFNYSEKNELERLRARMGTPYYSNYIFETRLTFDYDWTLSKRSWVNSHVQ